MGVGRNLEARGINAPRLQVTNFLKQHGQINNNSVADHRHAARGKNPARQEV